MTARNAAAAARESRCTEPPSQSSARATCGIVGTHHRFERIRRVDPAAKREIVRGGEFRVNSGAWNRAAVGNGNPGSTGTYQRSGRSSAVRRSPTPSAQAPCPAARRPGTSGTECQAECGGPFAEATAPQPVERDEHPAAPNCRCRVHPLWVCASTRPISGTARICGAQQARACRHRSVSGGYAGERVHAHQSAIVARTQPHRIAPTEQPEHRVCASSIWRRRRAARPGAGNRLSLAGAGQSDHLRCAPAALTAPATVPPRGQDGYLPRLANTLRGSGGPPSANQSRQFDPPAAWLRRAGEPLRIEQEAPHASPERAGTQPSSSARLPARASPALRLRAGPPRHHRRKLLAHALQHCAAASPVGARSLPVTGARIAGCRTGRPPGAS